MKVLTVLRQFGAVLGVLWSFVPFYRQLFAKGKRR